AIVFSRRTVPDIRSGCEARGAVAVGDLPTGEVTNPRTFGLSRCALGWREYYSVVGPAVAIGEHAPDWMIAVHVDAHRGAVPQFVADIEIDAFADEELAVAVHIDGFPGLALHRPRGVGKPWHGHLGRGRQFEAEIAGLAGL